MYADLCKLVIKHVKPQHVALAASVAVVTARMVMEQIAEQRRAQQPSPAADLPPATPAPTTNLAPADDPVPTVRDPERDFAFALIQQQVAADLAWQTTYRAQQQDAWMSEYWNNRSWQARQDNAYWENRYWQNR